MQQKRYQNYISQTILFLLIFLFIQVTSHDNKNNVKLWYKIITHYFCGKFFLSKNKLEYFKS